MESYAWTLLGVQFHLYCGRWYWGIVMGFHNGDSEGPLGVIRNLKLEVKPHWRDLQLSEGFPTWLRQVFAKCLPGLLWWFLLCCPHG